MELGWSLPGCLMGVPSVMCVALLPLVRPRGLTPTATEPEKPAPAPVEPLHVVSPGTLASPGPVQHVLTGSTWFHVTGLWCPSNDRHAKTATQLEMTGAPQPPNAAWDLEGAGPAHGTSSSGTQPIAPGSQSSFSTSSRAASMVSRAGLCCLDVLWGRGHTRKPSALLPPCAEVLGPGMAHLSPGTKRKRAVVKPDRAAPAAPSEDTGWEKGSGATPQGVGAWSEQATSHSGAIGISNQITSACIQLTHVQQRNKSALGCQCQAQKWEVWTHPVSSNQ